MRRPVSSFRAAAVALLAAGVAAVPGPSSAASRTGARCASSLGGQRAPLVAARQVDDAGTDLTNFAWLSPRFALYDDGLFVIQAFRQGDKREYGVAYGHVPKGSVDAIRRFLDEPEAKTFLTCASGDPARFTASDRSPGEMFVRVGGGLRVVPGRRLAKDLRRGSISARVIGQFQDLGNFVASLPAEGDLLPEAAYVSYRTVTGKEKFYNPVNRTLPIPAWENPPGFPGTRNLYETPCLTAKDNSRFWCDGWGIAEVLGCDAVDALLDRANRQGTVFVHEGATREFALTPLIPGFRPLDPAVLLGQKP